MLRALNVAKGGAIQRINVNSIVVKGVAGGVPVGEIVAVVVVNAGGEQRVAGAIGGNGQAVIGVVGVQVVHLHRVIGPADGDGEAAAGVGAAHVVHGNTGAGDRKAVGPDIV